ncbi:hypothetical protein ISU10_05315 [Nocardioides agariphilus]|uniref:Dienelactone hydrolase n=1 Tax=Nocardioides agariphilus TaxID=433664 RepID=A0A930VM56_9ACTN|nr:hypothetical protein [Nocardioides agariphilus]
MRAANGGPAAVVTSEVGSVDTEVDIPLAGGVVLRGHLRVPAGAPGVVVFAHGGGSSGHSSSDEYVAHQLCRAGLGTLLVDLLAPDEETEPRTAFETALLGARLDQVGRWLSDQPETGSCGRDHFLGYFAAGAAAAAALWAAAEPGTRVGAVVSHDGCPERAGERLPLVEAPTLLIVASANPVALDLNDRAKASMRCPCRLVVVPDARHRPDEVGTVEEVARLASAWFAGLLASEGPKPLPVSTTEAEAGPRVGS